MAVENVKLVNGNQQIAADGTFGRPGDALKVTLTNVDLATVDALLLRPPQLTGTLNASATVTGTHGRAGRQRGVPDRRRAASGSSATTRSAARSTTPARG